MRFCNLSNRKMMASWCGVPCAALLVLVGTTVPSFASSSGGSSIIDSFTDANGEQLVIQAENFTTNVINPIDYPVNHPQAGTPVQEGWDVINEANAAGGQAIQANANLGGGGDDNPANAGTAS